MADACDLAAEHMEAEEAHRAIHRAQAAKTRELTPKGRCHNPKCELDFDDDANEVAAAAVAKDDEPPVLKLFCNKKCSAEYESCKAGNRRFN